MKVKFFGPIVLTLALTGCYATAPIGPKPAAQMPLSVQATLIAAESTRIYIDSAQATEVRRLTQEALDFSRTATAYPVAMQQTQIALLPTQLAATALVQADDITKTAVVNAADIKLSQTAVARVDAASTRTARYQAEMTQQAQSEQLQVWRDTGAKFSTLAETTAIGVFWIFVILLLFAVAGFVWMFLLWQYRPRVINDRFMLPSPLGWRDITPPLRLPAAPTQQVVGDWDGWINFVQDVARAASIVGSWSINALSTRTGGAAVASEDDIAEAQRIAVEIGAITNYGGQHGFDWSDGWGLTDLCTQLDAGADFSLPHRKDGAPKPAPKADLSQCNATQSKTAKQTGPKAPNLKRSAAVS